MKKLIFIAGAYTAPKPEQVIRNVALAIRTALELGDLGFAFFCPHLFHFIECGAPGIPAEPRPYKFWTDIDDRMLICSDGLFRLDNASSGADLEVLKALDLTVPVFYSTDSLTAHFGPQPGAVTR